MDHVIEQNPGFLCFLVIVQKCGSNPPVGSMYKDINVQLSISLNMNVMGYLAVVYYQSLPYVKNSKAFVLSFRLKRICLVHEVISIGDSFFFFFSFFFPPWSFTLFAAMLDCSLVIKYWKILYLLDNVSQCYHVFTIEIHWHT